MALNRLDESRIQASHSAAKLLHLKLFNFNHTLWRGAHYHNGGVWPFIGGFYVAALVKARRLETAAQTLDRLTELNRSGEFNEWHHGQTHEPMGVANQAWSAALYLFACECVKRSDVPDGFFGIGGDAA